MLEATIAAEGRVEAQAAAASVRALRAAGVAGLVFAALMISIQLLIRDQPPGSPAEIPGWLARFHQRGVIALYLVPFAGIAFLWFLAAVRRRIGRREDQFFASVFIGSGLLFVATLFVSGAAASAIVALLEFERLSPDPDTVIYGRALAQTIFYVFAIKMAAAFMLVTSTIGHRTRVFPRWFVVAGVAIGLVMLFSVSFWEPLALLFPIWVAILSIILLRLRPEDWATT